MAPTLRGGYDISGSGERRPPAGNTSRRLAALTGSDGRLLGFVRLKAVFAQSFLEAGHLSP